MEEKQMGPIERFIEEHPNLVSFGTGLVLGASLMYFRMSFKPFTLTAKVEDLEALAIGGADSLRFDVPKHDPIYLVKVT
jgi:hypothetical protein